MQDRHLLVTLPTPSTIDFKRPSERQSDTMHCRLRQKSGLQESMSTVRYKMQKNDIHKISGK